MERKTFVQSTVAGLLTGLGLGETSMAAAPNSKKQPNILYILVDQLRFPKVFPEGIHSAADFLKHFMPNTYALWQYGVKFSNHFTAGVACTPSRGCLITGLYGEQSWLVQTITSRPGSLFALQPHLNKAYPTYGRLLRGAGYQTPYIGKWHVSLIRDGLEAYGFDGLTSPDPTGSNLQGTVGDHPLYLNDKDISAQACSWLHGQAARQTPWCLTVSFVNPHDKEFFWAGTEFVKYNNLFPPGGPFKPFTYYSEFNGTDYPPTVTPADNPLKEPPHFGYDAVPPNWETPADFSARRKPSTQTYTQTFQAAVWGGVAFTPGGGQFGVDAYPPPTNGQVPPSPYYGVANAPFEYWRRNLDSYTQIMQIVDERIGEVLHAFLQLPRDIVENTVIVFTSDHGEYAGAHGYVSGKVGTAYDEAYHVPLIVADPTRRFNGDIDIVRDGLTSSVDMLGLLVSLAYNGSRQWLNPFLAQLYGGRHDLIPMLKSANAPGRRFVMLATDEVVPGYLDFNNSPGHIVAVRTRHAKLAIYAHWIGNTDVIDTQNGLETEYYDYSTEAGRLELANDPENENALKLRHILLNDLIPNELRAPLPAVLRLPQTLSRDAYLAYNQFLANLSPTSSGPSLPFSIGYGAEF